jgi:CRP-like cAMP-binding protein
MDERLFPERRIMARQFVLNLPTLRRLNIFPWASDCQLEQLLPHVSLQQVKRRTLLFPERDESDRLYLLLSGVVKLSLPNIEGEEVLISLLRPGELFGITALMPKMQRAFRCETFSDCLVGVVQAKLLVTSLLGIPFTDFTGMMGSSVNRWFTLLYRYARFQGLNTRQRLMLALLELAQKFGVPDARGVIISLRLTHDDLADLVGASRQRVTEHMKDLESQHLLQRDGRRLIILPQRLRDMVGAEVTSEEAVYTDV